MKWVRINGDTQAMQVGKGIVLRTGSFEQVNDNIAISESMCFVPDCRIIEGSCSERAKIVTRTETR